MLDFHEPHDFASDEIDQREREMVAAMAKFVYDGDGTNFISTAPPTISPYITSIEQAHEHAQKLVQQFFASPLDANDDDERMTSNGYLVRTSTERINDMETRIKRIEAMWREWTGGR